MSRCGIFLLLLFLSARVSAQTDIDTLFARAFREHTFSGTRQQILDSILRLDPQNAYAWQQKAMPLFKQKKYELGMLYVDSAVKYDKQRWLPYRAFIKCVFAKTYRDAIEDFLACEQMFPRGIVMDHTYDFYRGMCHLQLNEFDTAARLIGSSIDAGITRNGQGHFFEYWYLGIAMMELGQHEKAIRAFDLGLQGYSRFSDIKYYKALCLKATGKSAEVDQLLREALADLDAGYTISEDSVIYEEFPYQVRRYWITNKLRVASAK